jgi:type II secretion system protein J
MTRQRSNSFARGFTLIEMMLAIGIMAMVLAAMMSVFFGALHLRDHVVASIDHGLPAQLATGILRRDLVCAMAPGGVLAGDFKVGTLTEPNQNRPVSIEMYTPTGALRDSEPWADIQMVTYELKSSASQSASGGNDLVRSVTRNLLSTTTPDVQEQTLLGGVQELRFSCFDGTEWQDDWDTTSANTNLPVAIRASIRFTDNTTGPVELVVPLVAQVRTNQVQTVAQ